MPIAGCMASITFLITSPSSFSCVDEYFLVSFDSFVACEKKSGPQKKTKKIISETCLKNGINVIFVKIQNRMQRIKIGVLREEKSPPDKRVPLTPLICADLTRKYP